nr:MAG TPA: hypothetical protein [Caudoviricetes sp.]
MNEKRLRKKHLRTKLRNSLRQKEHGSSSIGQVHNLQKQVCLTSWLVSMVTLWPLK